MMRYSTKENQIHNIIPPSENNTLQKDDTTQINHIIQPNNSKNNTEINYNILISTRRYAWDYANNTVQTNNTIQTSNNAQMYNSAYDNNHTLLSTTPRRYSTRGRHYYYDENNSSKKNYDDVIVLASCVLFGPLGFLVIAFL